MLLKTLFFSTITMIGCKPNAHLMSNDLAQPVGNQVSNLPECLARHTPSLKADALKYSAV